MFIIVLASQFIIVWVFSTLVDKITRTETTGRNILGLTSFLALLVYDTGSDSAQSSSAKPYKNHIVKIPLVEKIDGRVYKQ